MGGILYAADPPEARLLVALDALDLIYHRASGITHVVSEPVPQILEALEAGPAGAAEIVRRLAEAHEIDAIDAEAIVEARLAELEAVGLVWRYSVP